MEPRAQMYRFFAHLSQKTLWGSKMNQLVVLYNDRCLTLVLTVLPPYLTLEKPAHGRILSERAPRATTVAAICVAARDIDGGGSI